MDDIIIRLTWFPTSINAVTVPDAEGNYNIYINDCLCFNQQQKAINHELEHIRNKDFESYLCVSVLEKNLKVRIEV